MATPDLSLRVDPNALRTFLDRASPERTVGPLRISLLSGGRSNLTYALDDERHSWVLRRPPAGLVLPSAHDMSREVRVLQALWQTSVPVPKVIASSDDTTVIGAPFYVMERVQGTVLRDDEDFSRVPPARGLRVGNEFISILARLHRIEPSSVGLSQFGRPDGFASRQLRRWNDQRGRVWVRDVEGMETLATKLAVDPPVATTASILHGDYRLDNVVVDLDRSRIAAVLDWEMATLGDPLMDLGLAHLYWLGWGGIENPIAGTPGLSPTFPSWEELIEQYSAQTGFDITTLDWYVAFAFFKLAVILEGIHSRYIKGWTLGDGFAGIGKMVEPLVERGLAALNGQPSR